MGSNSLNNPTDEGVEINRLTKHQQERLASFLEPYSPHYKDIPTFQKGDYNPSIPQENPNVAPLIYSFLCEQIKRYRLGSLDEEFVKSESFQAFLKANGLKYSSSLSK